MTNHDIEIKIVSRKRKLTTSFFSLKLHKQFRSYDGIPAIANTSLPAKDGKMHCSPTLYMDHGIYLLFIKIDSVMMLTTSITTTTGMLPMFAWNKARLNLSLIGWPDITGQIQLDTAKQISHDYTTGVHKCRSRGITLNTWNYATPVK